MALFKNKYRIESARLPTWYYRWNAAYFITICTKNREHFMGEIKNGIIENEMEYSESGKKAWNCWAEIPEHFPFVTLDAFTVMPNHIHGILILNNPINYPNATLQPNETLPVNKTLQYNVSTQQKKIITDNEMSDPAETLHCNVSDVHNVSATQNEIPEKNKMARPAETLHCNLSDVHNVSATQNEIPEKNKIARPVETLQCNVSTMQNNDPDFQTNVKIKNESMAAISPKKGSVSTIVRSYKSAVSKQVHLLNPHFLWQERFHEHIIRNEDEFYKIRNYILCNTQNWIEDMFYS